MVLIVEGSMIEAEKLVEEGMPIGRYPGITLRNAHFQYIVTWYGSPGDRS
jgi:cytochrome oxidase assembly protein ShyY1